jgi:hypothetical protein
VIPRPLLLLSILLVLTALAFALEYGGPALDVLYKWL